ASIRFFVDSCMTPLALTRVESHSCAMPRRKTTEEFSPSGHPCTATGCHQDGTHRAPKTRGETPEYLWFCLEHVREYNKSWNYFEGMSREEIEDYMKDAVTGHRPTWYMGGNGAASPERLQEALERFMSLGMKQRTPVTPPIPRKLKKALDELEMEHPTTHKDIKKRYKALVKQYHPDVNRADKDAEERFKSITQAYRDLMSDYPEHGIPTIV
ncbi:MAG: J domain-containing protein, partial [Rickettsiales bacterium]|nr:J domain-containing protein [Rickettsiales bacterium]